MESDSQKNHGEQEAKTSAPKSSFGLGSGVQPSPLWAHETLDASLEETLALKPIERKKTPEEVRQDIDETNKRLNIEPNEEPEFLAASVLDAKGAELAELDKWGRRLLEEAMRPPETNLASTTCEGLPENKSEVIR